MSLETWKAEFYPIDAAELAESSWRGCVEHSIKKWEGLLPTNLVKHNVEINGRYATDDSGDEFGINAYTCALCQRSRDQCEDCPLYKALGDVRCDDDTFGPYNYFCEEQDPEPMIDALNKALEYCND